MTKSKPPIFDSKSYEDLVKTRLPVDDAITMSRLEHALGWRDWIQHIPFIPFPPEWEVQVIPPFSGALSRFRVQLRDNHDCYVSVYLDVTNALGAISWDEYKPYWEVYPAKDGRTDRCQMNDIPVLLEIISDSLASQRDDEFHVNQDDTPKGRDNE